MDFDAFDKKMRGFEQSLDRLIPDDVYLVARLDGRGFTRLTKKEWDLEKPFDIKFRDAMVDTVKHLLADCGFRMVYGYTQSDEISVLFHKDDTAFSHKERKLLTILSAEASVKFSELTGRHAVFDCRLLPLPTIADVIDCFRWRQEDAHRNSLNSHTYWALRKSGVSQSAAERRMSGISNEEKIAILSNLGIDFSTVPLWQKYGVGIYFADEIRKGFNPKTNTETECITRVLKEDYFLPKGEEYGEFVRSLVATSLAEE